MVTRGIFLGLLCFLLLAVFPSGVDAKKRLPQASPATVRSSGGGAGSGPVSVSVKLRGDRRAIVVGFSNLERAAAVSYELTYTKNGISEGAGGVVSTSSGSASRELLFGTCSKGVCTYHTNIKNARFVVTITLSNGKKVVKSFKLRV